MTICYPEDIRSFVKQVSAVSMNPVRVAVIGLGAMGFALAATILHSGAKVRVWNRTPAKSTTLRELGAIACATASEAISESDFVVVCVSDYPAWSSIVDKQDLGQALTNRTLIQLTTGTIEQVQRQGTTISGNLTRSSFDN